MKNTVLAIKSLVLSGLVGAITILILSGLTGCAEKTKTACWSFQAWNTPFTILGMNQCTGEHKEIILRDFEEQMRRFLPPAGTIQRFNSNKEGPKT